MKAWGGSCLHLAELDGLASTKILLTTAVKNAQPKHRLFTHIGRMIGGYTATVTAVLVVNGDRLPFVVPEFLLWLSPTLILTPISIYWIRQRK